MALVLTGRGQVWYRGELAAWGQGSGEKAGLQPIQLASKEGLALVSGTTSPTALASIGLYDMLQAEKTADVVGP